MTGRRQLALGGILALWACAKPAPPDETTLRAEDRAALEPVVALDVRASQAMREADSATGKGEADAAVDALTARARPAVEQALRAAENATVNSGWGRGKRDELLAILRDRKAEIPKYEEAVRGGDPEKLLASIEAQAAIERRALATVAAVKAGR